MQRRHYDQQRTSKCSSFPPKRAWHSLPVDSTAPPITYIEPVVTAFKYRWALRTCGDSCGPTAEPTHARYLVQGMVLRDWDP